MAAQLKCSVNIPYFGFFEDVQLLLCCKHQMTAAIDADVCLKDFCWDMIIINCEIQIFWVF